jgi:predicted hydrocarbon binding protein
VLISFDCCLAVVIGGVVWGWVSQCFVVVESCEICGDSGCDGGGVCVRESGLLGGMLSHSGGEGLWVWVGCFLVSGWGY